jgi:hypothetical protein
VRGPGTPYNTIYYGTDRLHRSADGGATNPTVSQAPINGSGVPISAIAVAPSNDAVRLVATNNFNVATGAAVAIKVMGTVTGSSTLLNFTSASMPTAKYCSRIAIDPTDPNTAFVAFGGFGVPAGQHIWKTTNLMTGTPAWAAAGNGLPDVPVNALAIDPLTPGRVWCGTDVGVYVTTDGGANWSPYVTGMPIVSVFDMSLQPVARKLRVATHGRGIWERSVDAPVATDLALVGAEIVAGHPSLTWYSADGANETVRLYRRVIPGDWARLQDLQADGTGMITYTDPDVQPGHSYEYRIGLLSGGQESFLGQVWVDVPATATFALRRASGMSDRGALRFVVSLPSSAPARLELMDVTGRRVAGQDVTALGSGEHEVVLDASGTSQGVYWARLSQAGRMLSSRVVLVR